MFCTALLYLIQWSKLEGSEFMLLVTSITPPDGKAGCRGVRQIKLLNPVQYPGTQTYTSLKGEIVSEVSNVQASEEATGLWRTPLTEDQPQYPHPEAKISLITSISLR